MHPTTTVERPATARPLDSTASGRTATALRSLMAAKRLRSSDLAAHFKMSRASAGRWMRGDHDFKLTEVERLATWLEVEPSDLILGSEQ